MAQYVDGYVIPIARKNIRAYKNMATWGKKVWMKHGAIHYYECIGDDFSKYGMGFKKLCKLKSGETFVFAFIVYKSKAHRNQVNKKVMAEMSKFEPPKKMPISMKRFCMAGCKVLVSQNRR